VTVFALQYLENTPGVGEISPEAARTKLRAAFDLLPITHLLLGWNLPQPLVDACSEEARRNNAQFFRWHLLLTGDGLLFPRPEWRTIGLGGEPVPGFRKMPEFTFICPNNPGGREAILSHFQERMGSGEYDGVFLDRMRYPSPAAGPSRWFACFCDDCFRVAAGEGLDLPLVQIRLLELMSTPEKIPALLHLLLGPDTTAINDPDLVLLNEFLDFRARCISRLVAEVVALAKASELGVGLDCFSPALTRLVAQELASLDRLGEWTKVMSYGHTLGPAGLPFELMDLASWLTKRAQVSERGALEWLAQATRLPLPTSRDALRANGLPPIALAAEMKHARSLGVSNLLAGIELVEMEGVTRLNEAQITADLLAIQSCGVDGLVLSWDLWHMSLERLRVVSQVWGVD
jgi:hypothetical protein